MSELEDLRKRIDDVDAGMTALFAQRMELAAEVADYKRANALPVLDKARERAKLASVAEQVPPELHDQVQVLYSLVMDMSKAAERRRLGADGTLEALISDASGRTPALFPQDAFVACQGVEGAYSQIAADKLFRHPSISFFDTFEGVFRAVDEGFSSYGVLPVENSTAGTVNQVYDLMMRHDFHIVRTVRLKVDHSLLAKRGTGLADARDVYSHEQAIEQCSAFLDAHPEMRVHVVENTAVAAKMVSESGRADVAALSSRTCAELYGLETLERSVQDTGNNYTRFACISKGLEIYPGADRTSLMMIVSHEPGSLYKVLARFYALDINLVKLESRPLPDRDFEFMFYFDLECPVAAPAFRDLVVSLGEVCEEFRYLGSYSEQV